METQNIYNKKDSQNAKDKSLPAVDLTMAQARSRTIRNALWFIGLVLVFLGIASWLVYRQDDQQTTAATNEDLTVSLQVPLTTNAALSPLKPPSAWNSKALPSFADVAPKTDPEVMARAMGEVRIGQQYLRANDLENAEIHARKAVEIYPDINAGQRLLGMVYIHQGQFDQAIAILERAMKTDPFNPETYNNMATAYIQKRMYDKAEELLQTALQLQPGFIPSFFNMGLLNLAAGRYESAADYLDQALSHQSNNPTARNNLAVALIRIGRLDEARVHLRMLIEQQPNLAAAYFNMAISYGMEDNVEEAMAWIRQGAAHCTPVICQKFLSDTDFNSIRQKPAFQEFVKSLYPEAPPVVGPIETRP